MFQEKTANLEAPPCQPAATAFSLVLTGKGCSLDTAMTDVRILGWLLLLTLLPLLAGCLAPGVGEDPAIRKVAVVSLTVSNWRGIGINGMFGTASSEQIVQAGTAELLRISEEELSKRWQVVPTQNFNAAPAFRNLEAAASYRVLTPLVVGAPLPVFAPTIKDLLKGNIDAEKARALCTVLGVDAVVIIFSDWTTKTGSMFPTIKAVTKNVVTIWDAKGNKRFAERRDMVGKKAIGSHRLYELSEETLGEWISTYQASFAALMPPIR